MKKNYIKPTMVVTDCEMEAEILSGSPTIQTYEEEADGAESYSVTPTWGGHRSGIWDDED
ncbi:MAG: hypothetical protein NC388_10085 [Clostridium sp.]|nr:hypothetical protein [Clostridium sp.]